jgi:hypothetical protein
MNETGGNSKKKEKKKKHNSWSLKCAYYCPIKFIDKMILQAYVQIDTRFLFNASKEKMTMEKKLSFIIH